MTMKGMNTAITGDLINEAIDKLKPEPFDLYHILRKSIIDTSNRLEKAGVNIQYTSKDLERLIDHLKELHK